MGNEGSIEGGEGLGGYTEGDGRGGFAQIPAGMEADLSRLSEEERKQIAAVMSRAQEQPADRSAIRNPTNDPSQSPRHQSKPPDPGPTGLSKSRTVDAFKTETKPPGRSPSAMSLREPKSKPDIKEDQKTGLMSGFLAESNPMNMVSSVVNKFNPFDAKSDSKEELLKQQMEKEQENKEDPKSINRASPQMQHQQGHAKAPIPTQQPHMKSTQQGPSRTSMQPSTATKSLPHTPNPNQPLPGSANSTKPLVQEPKHTTSLPHGQGSKKEPMKQDISAKPIPSTMDKQSFPPPGSSIPTKISEREKTSTQPSVTAKQPFQEQASSKMPQPQQTGTVKAPLQQSSPIKQQLQQSSPSKIQGHPQQAVPTSAKQVTQRPEPTPFGGTKQPVPVAGKSLLASQPQPLKDQRTESIKTQIQDTSQTVAKAGTKNMCPLCKTTELMLDGNKKPNYNTCTQCKITVCSLCGFNPNPHITEMQEWLCLNCQMQRALGMDMAGPPMPQPGKQKPAAPLAGVSVSSPKKEPNVVPDKLMKQGLKASPVVQSQISAPDSPSKSNQPATESRTGKPTISEKSKPIVPEKKQTVEPSQTVSSQPQNKPDYAPSPATAETKITDSIKTVFQQSAKEFKQFALPGQHQITAQEVETSQLKEDSSKSPKKIMPANQLAQKEVPLPISPKPSPLDKPVTQQASQLPELVSSKPSLFQKPVTSQSSMPGSPKSSPVHKPAAPQATQLSGPGSPKSSPAHKPVPPQSTQPSAPGSPKPIPAHKPVAPQATQSSGPGSPKSSPVHKPVAPQSIQSSVPGSPKSSPAHRPVAPQAAQSSGPGSPKSSPVHKPVAPQSTQPSGPGSPKPSPAHKPTGPQSTQLSGTGSPKSSSAHKPVAPQSTQSPGPGSPKFSPFHKPTVPQSTQPFDPGSPKSSPAHKPAVPQSTQPSGPGSPKPSPLHKPASPQTTQSSGPGSPKPSPPHKPVVPPPNAPGSPKPSPPQKPVISQTTSQPTVSTKPSPLPKPGSAQVAAQPTAQPPRSQEQSRRFSLNLGSVTEAPKIQPTTPQETVTGKLFGFGASIFSQASSFISTTAQPGTQTQSTQGTASKQPVPAPAQKLADNQKPTKEPTVPHSPKLPVINKETQPVPSKVSEEPKLSPLRKEIDDKKMAEKAAKKDIPELSKTATVEPEIIEKIKEAKTLCPLCKTELNIGSKDLPNFNTCTECKNMVCNLCGFNPTPHLTEAAEWLCLNCQTQRALLGSLGDLDRMPQPIGLSPKSSPKHHILADQPQKQSTDSTPSVKLNEKTTDQVLKKEMAKDPEGKRGHNENVIDEENKDIKPIDIKPPVIKEDTVLVTPVIAQVLPFKEHKQDDVQDTALVTTDYLQSEGKMMPKQDLMIDLSATALKEIDGETCDERIKPGASQLIDHETGKEKTEKEDDKSDTSNSQQQKSPQGLSDTGYSSDGISGSLGEIPSLIPSDEKDLIKEATKKDSLSHEISPSSPSDLAKLESTVLSILEAQTSVLADEKLRKGNDLYGKYAGQTQDRSRTKILPITPESYSSEEELEDIQEEEEETLENGKKGLPSRKFHKEGISKAKDVTIRKRQDSIDDSSESENSPIPQRKRRTSNGSSSSDDFKHDDSPGSGDDEDFIRKQIIEMSADEDASGSEDEEFIRTKLKEISANESKKRETKTKPIQTKCKRLTKKSSASYDDDGIRRHSWHDDDEEDEDEETFDESPEPKFRETKSQENEELSLSAGGGLRRFKTIELNSTMSNTYTEETSKPSTKLYYDEEPELEMESLTDSPEDRSREERSSSLHASSFTPGTSPTSVSSLDEDSDSSPSHKKISGESKQQRKARHRSHGPVLPTIEDSSEEEELREEEELLKEQEKQRELEQQQQQRKSSSKKSKKDKDELRAQRRRERPKTPPSNLSPIEDASPTEELRQAAEMEELHRSSCSEYSPSIESEPEGFEINPEKILEVQKVYKLPTSVSLYSPTEVTANVALAENTNGQQTLKSAEEAYEDILCKAKLYHSDKEKEDVFEKEPLYGGMLIEDYIYESLVEENYDEILDANIIGSQHNIFDQRSQDVKNNSAGDIITNTAQTIASADRRCFKTETFHPILPQEDIVSSSYIVPESHEIIILDNTDDRQCHEDATGFYEIITSQDMQLTPGSSPTQHRNEFNMKTELTSSMNVNLYKTENMILTASVDSSSLNSMSIPDVKITQHFTAEEPEDDVIADYSVEKASDYCISENTEVSIDGQYSANASCNEDGVLKSGYSVSQSNTQLSQTSAPSDICSTDHVIISVPDVTQSASAQTGPLSSTVCAKATSSTGYVPLEDKTKEHSKDASNAVTGFLINHEQPMTTVCIVSTKHNVTSTAVTHATTAAQNLQSVISSAPSVTSKVMSFFKTSDSTDPVTAQKSVSPRPPPPPPPPLPPAATPKPALSSKKRPAPKIPTAKAKPTPVEYNNRGVQEGSPLKISSTPTTRHHAPPPPVPPKPSSIPAGLVFSHRTIESSKPHKETKPVSYESPVAMQKRLEAQHKSQAHSIPTIMTLNLVSSADHQLPSPTSPLSPHSNKSSPRLAKLSQETYVVITLPSEPGTTTESDSIHTTTCWPLQTTVHKQVPEITQTVFSNTPLSISKKVTVNQASDILHSLSPITVEEAKTTVSLSQSPDSEFTCIPDVFPTERTVSAQSQLKLVGKPTESNDIIDLRTLNKMDYKVKDFEVDSCMDLSSTTEVKRQSSAFSSVNRPISAVQPAIVNLSTASPVVSSLLLVTESITVMTCSTTVSYASSLESLVDLGNSMKEPLKLTTSKQYEDNIATYAVDVEVPINLSLGIPAHLIAASTTKPFQVTSGSVTNGSTDISTSQESVDSGVVDLSTTKFLRTMVTVDDAASTVVTEIIEDDKPVDLTAGRRAVCCDVVYKLPFGRSCISQQPSTTLPEDRFGYRDDHYQYDRSGISGFRGIGGMKPSMSDTNLAEAGLFLYRSKNTFDYPVGIADGIAVDLTSGKITTGEALDYQTKTTGSYPETRQVISGLGISAPQYSQARMTASIVPPYGMGSVLRSSNGVVYSSVTSPIPSTFAITTQPGSIFSTTAKDLSTFTTTDTVTSLSSLNQTQPIPRTYSILTSAMEDVTDVMSVIDTSLQSFPMDVAASTQGDLDSILTSESETFSEITEDESSFIIPADDGKQQHLHLQRELLELEKLKQQRLAEELEWERQEIQRFREQETFMVQKKLEELQSMKQHLLYQQEEERQAQFMMRQETLAQQQLHLEKIQQLQQQLHQQLEEQKIRQMYQYGYDSENVPPQTSSEQVIIEGQYSAPEDGQFWTCDHTATTSSVVAGVDMTPGDAWYAVQSDGVTQYISRPGILNSVSELSLKDMDINDERQLKKRSSMPRLSGMYDEIDGSMQDDPRSYKLIADSGVQTDEEDGNDNRFTGRRRKSKKGVDTSVQTDDEDQDEWDIPTRSRRRSRAGKYSDGSSDADKSRQFSKVSNMAVQTVAEISVQTEPLGTIRTPSIRAKVDSKVEIIKHISAPEKSYKGESLGCQTETDSDVQSPPYLNDLSQKDKRRPTPLEIGYSSHLRAESSLQVAPSPPKSPKVLYSPISPVSPSKAIESAFVPYDKTVIDDIGTHKNHAEIVQIPPPSPKSPKVMQRSMSDPKPLSPTAEDMARTQFQYSDGYSTKTMQNGTQKKVKRTLPNPPPEEAVSGLQSTYSTVGSVSRRRICRNTTMARAKILQDIDRELDLVERESSKLRKKQAELDEEEKEIDAKLRYLEMGINRRKEALLKEREKRERAYLQGVAEERDYMSDSEVSNTRPTRIENHLGLDRPQTTAQTEYSPYLPPQTQTETPFAPQTSPYTQYQYQTPTLLTQAPTQFPQQSLYQQPLYHQQVSSYQTQSTFQAVPTMSYTPQPQSTQSQQSSYQHTSQLLLLQQKARQSALDLDAKIASHYDVIRNQPLIIAPVSTDSSYSVSHLGSKYSTLDLRLGLDEKSSMASSPMSSISADSFYADLEHHASRNYVLIDDIGELTKGSGSMSSAFGLHEKELSKTDRLLRTVDSRRTPEVTDFLSPISTSNRLHTYGKGDEDSMEDPYELKLLKHQIKQEFRRGTETLDPLAGFSPYYHSDSLYRHFPKSEKYSISRLTLEKQAAKQLPPAILYQKQPKHKKSLIDQKISKFSPIQENRDLEPDYSTYLSSSTSSIPSISSKVRLLQDDITYGLRKNITDQQKFLGPALAQSLGTTLNTNLRTAIQDEVDKPYVSGNRSRPSSRPSSVYGLDLSMKRDLSSTSLRQKAESEALEGTFSHAAPSGRTKPSSLPISQSRGRIPIVAQNSEEESPLSPVGQPMGMARAAAGPLPPISADTRDQFGSSHSLPEVQQHMREESRTRGYDRDIAFIMDDFHAMSDSEENSFNDAYHLRREETDWFDKPRESRLENGHGIERKLPDKLSHTRPAHPQEQMNGKPIHYPFPHTRIKLLRDPKDHTVSGNGFGMRIVGGKEIPGSQGEIGAYIAKIFPGGSAEQTGRLTEGMLVLEWNSFQLTAKTYEEVQSIISQSSGEADICVRLDISMLSNSATPQNLELHDPGKAVEKTKSPGVDPKQLAAELQKVSQQQTPSVVSSGMEKGSYIHSGTTSAASSAVPSPGQPGSPSVSKKRHSGKSTDAVKAPSHPITGEIQLQVNYDKHLGNLIIHILQARNLVPRDNNGYSDPFVKVYLLPGRGQVMVVQNASAEYKRRTKYVQKSLNPEWNQTVIYKSISMEQLKKKTLEVTVWDYDRFSSNDFLGEVLIDLSNASYLDNMPRWYPLKEQSESIDHAKSHPSHSSQQVPKPSVIKSRSHGIFPDPSKDMQVPTIEKSHSSPGSSKSSSEGHLRSHGPSRSQSKSSVTQTHLEDAGVAIAAAEAAVQQLRLQPTHKSGQSNYARKQHRHSIAGVLPIQRTQSDNLPSPANDSKDQSQLALKKTMSDGSVKAEARPATHRTTESTVSTTSSVSSFGSGYSMDSDSNTTQGDSNLFQVPRIGKMNQNGQDQTGLGLTETEGKTQVMGEIKIALKKEMKTDGEQLIVEILQCRNITYKFKSPDHLPDLYVKLYVINIATQKRIIKKKTRVCRHDREPSFNETFRFSMSPAGHSLQILLASNGGKFMKKTLIGEAYIWLDKVDLRKRIVNWHKLLASSTQAH
ncbi:protein piccolo isoform X2 [Ranitomeya variabilis]|uniref:protein piccolo isoform X2 n=1 Tax=Ranitomeya variabilis TaxID=490064 RepID=UPI004055F35A